MNEVLLNDLRPDESFRPDITEEEANILITMHKRSMTTVLLTIKGLGLLAIEAAINAALGVARDTINTAIGWKLL